LGVGTRSATGNINIGGVDAGSSSNAINIGIGSGSTSTLNIGRGNVISIVNSATPTLSISRPIQPTYTATAPNANTMIGFIATPTVTVLSNLSSTPTNIASFPLTVGTWIVQARILFAGVPATPASNYIRLSFTTSTTVDGNLIGDWNQDNQSGGVNINYSTNFQLTGTTTIYCRARCGAASAATTSSMFVNAIRVA
jgi:hypothetical protein